MKLALTILVLAAALSAGGCGTVSGPLSGFVPDTRYCLKHLDSAPCRQNGNPYVGG